MARQLYVSNTVSDEDIYRAFGQFFGNNAVERIDYGNKKTVHISSIYSGPEHEDLEGFDEDLEEEKVVTFCLWGVHSEGEWWIYQSVGEDCGDKTHFDCKL